VKARTSRRAGQEREYAKLRLVFLEENPGCQAGPGALPRAGCTAWATQVHHMAGRDGYRLLDQSRWRALCGPCHVWVTEHPFEAFEVGLSLHRSSDDVL
jgi:hypothetical protein